MANSTISPRGRASFTTTIVLKLLGTIGAFLLWLVEAAVAIGGYALAMGTWFACLMLCVNIAGSLGLAAVLGNTIVLILAALLSLGLAVLVLQIVMEPVLEMGEVVCTEFGKWFTDSFWTWKMKRSFTVPYRSLSILYPDNWDEIRRQVLLRDGSVCGNCGSGKHLHVHHIVPLTVGGSNALTNLRTLCDDCHKLLHPHMRDLEGIVPDGM